MNKLPTVIQGGMGVGVSGWQLASAVSSTGQLGVVSGTALDAVMVRRLQLGDIGGHVRRALSAFPIADITSGILDRYFIDGGKGTNVRFRTKPMWRTSPSRRLTELTVAANFVEVFLAKEAHGRPVGINFLEKIQVPTLASLYGAILAGVDYVLIGAGIPRAIPEVLDRLAANLKTRLRIDVKGSLKDEDPFGEFDPAEFTQSGLPDLKRPSFIAIVASDVLATMLARKSGSTVEGFVVEAPSAGGHNAPPRGKAPLSEEGEPVYGPRDIPNLEAIAELGLPFWLAGSQAHPDAVTAALEVGATGVQVGTAFAFCNESGLEPERRQQVIDLALQSRVDVFTDPVASPTGFPFKVAQLEGTLSEQTVYEERTRICDLGYLRNAYRRPDGSTGWRCPAEPVEDYVAKGGLIPDTVGRKCLCNALMANIGLGQITESGDAEPHLLTTGDDIASIGRILGPGATSYSAADVVDYLMAEVSV